MTDSGLKNIKLENIITKGFEYNSIGSNIGLRYLYYYLLFNNEIWRLDLMDYSELSMIDNISEKDVEIIHKYKNSKYDHNLGKVSEDWIKDTWEERWMSDDEYLKLNDALSKIKRNKTIDSII